MSNIVKFHNGTRVNDGLSTEGVDPMNGYVNQREFDAKMQALFDEMRTRDEARIRELDRQFEINQKTLDRLEDRWSATDAKLDATMDKFERKMDSVVDRVDSMSKHVFAMSVAVLVGILGIGVSIWLR